jgi:hypothetical protein
MNIETPQIHLHFEQLESVQFGIALDFNFG